MQKNKVYDIVIVGGGLAGLAAAIRLKKKFNSVLILEKNKNIGGKLDAFEWQDYRWDKGPSLFTEPELLDELFSLWDRNPRDYFNYEKLEDSCNYYFADCQHITLSENEETQNTSIKKVTGDQGVQEVESYKARSAEMFNAVGDYFISNPKPKASNVFGKELMSRYKYLIKPEVRKSLDNLNSKHFTHPHLINIFNRFGTYNGSNPYEMSGLFSSIAHVELNKGAYFPTKGMRSIVDSLHQLSEEIGIDIHYNSEVALHPSKNNTFQVKGTTEAIANNVVCAIDHLQFYKSVLKNASQAKKWAKTERSTSGLVFYWAVDTKIQDLKVHNIFFSEDYKKEFTTLFEEKQLATDPTFYVHISSNICPEHAPQDGQNWFVMVNTPAGVIPNLNYRTEVKKKLIQRIKKQFGMDISAHIKHEDFWDCHAIQKHSGSYLGALYGPASNSLLSSIKKHGNKSTEHPNLFFCGGTVHPGGGIPLVLRSAKIVSNLVK